MEEKSGYRNGRLIYPISVLDPKVSLQGDDGFSDVYIGVGDTAEEVMVVGNHHDYVTKDATVSVTASDENLWVILPNEFTPSVQIGGMSAPMTEQSEITYRNVTYRVLCSNNTYDGTFSVSLT